VRVSAGECNDIPEKVRQYCAHEDKKHFETGPGEGFQRSPASNGEK